MVVVIFDVPKKNLFEDLSESVASTGLDCLERLASN
jgi:hypothetical protein